MASSKARQLEAVQAQQEFSVEQLQVYKRALQEAEARLENARRSAISTSLTGSLVNVNNLGYANALLEQATVDADEQRSRLADLRAQFAGRLRDNDLQLLAGGQVGPLAAQLTALQSQLGRAQLTEGTANGGASTRLQIARKSAELETALTDAAARALPGASTEARELAVRYRLVLSDLAARESWRAWLSSQVGVYQREVVMAPNRELDISRLQAEVDQQRALYNAFQQQSAAAQIAEAFQNAKVSGRFLVMEPATRPLSPGKPNRPLLVILAFVIGGIVGARNRAGGRAQRPVGQERGRGREDARPARAGRGAARAGTRAFARPLPRRLGGRRPERCPRRGTRG